ncbi:hypothetical protein KQH82_13490 [bacterium]|nr:hypothetical protein [bacterium]
MAASAAIGLTAFLEYRELSSRRLLERFVGEVLGVTGDAADRSINRSVFEELTKRITRCVQTRLLLEDLSRASGLEPVEAYRLFVAAHCDRTSVNTILDIVQTAVLYGDVLPTDLSMNKHPLAFLFATSTAAVCRRFTQRLSSTRSDLLLDLGCEWVKALCENVLDTIHTFDEQESSAVKADGEKSTHDTDTVLHREQAVGSSTDHDNLAIRPADVPQKPGLFDSVDVSDLLGRKADEPVSEFERDLMALRKHLGEESDEEWRARTLANFNNAVREASGRQAQWEDMRSDLLEFVLISGAFETGPIEGNPTDGHLVSVNLDTDETVTGEQFDCTVALSEDIVALAELLEASRPTIDAIRRILYPSVERVPVTQRVCTSGTLDPARLALGDMSSAVFRRSRMIRQPDRRGRALLVVACDGSGSLDSNQMRVLKILTCSWLVATARSDVQVLAGLYHSGAIRSGLVGPLVQWVAHPRRTVATSNQDAARALVSLPNTGTGIQQDALSLAYIMDEARRLTSGTIYLIHLTDCKWNESFDTGIGGEEEVHSLLRSWRNDIPDLHITTVGLGVANETGLEHLVDKTIALSDAELEDETAVTDKIGRYVASCMAERRHQLIL